MKTSVLQILQHLIKDDNAYFYPNHKNFSYKRISRKETPVEGFPKFIPHLYNKCPFADLTWSKDRLNLSVRTKIEGNVSTTVGMVQTFSWKNYTFIKDGELNIDKIPASFSKETFEILNGNGLFNENEYIEDWVYTINLTNVPILCKMDIDEYISAKDLADWTFLDNLLSAKLKVLKELRRNLAPDVIKATPFTEKYTKTELEYLFSIGFKSDGSFDPPSKEEEAKGTYLARTFEIKVKGWSNLPKLDDVLSKAKEGKKLTDPQLAMFNAYRQYYSEGIAQLTRTDERINFLDNNIKSVKEMSNDLRERVQRAKFYVIVGKKNLSGMENVSANITFEIGEKEIAY